MNRFVAVCVVVTLVTACSAPDSDNAIADSTVEPETTMATRTTEPTTEPTTDPGPTGPEWAMPGLAFLNELGSAIEAGDVEEALAFYHPDARLFAADAGGTAIGWRQIGDVIERRTPHLRRHEIVLIGGGLGAVLSAVDECGDGDCPGPAIDVFWIWDGAIGVQLHSSDAPPPPGDSLLDLYFGSAAAYTAHDVDGLRSFYSDAVFAPPFPAEEYETLFDGFPELAATPLTFADLGLGDVDGPAVFDLGTTGASSNRSTAGIGVYEVTFDSGVTVLAATLWRLWDGRIVEAATVFDANGWDRMLELAGLEPPPSWFTDIETPEPRVVERTHVVDVGDGTVVELFDATDEVAGLVEWTLGRFKAAGLRLPHVDAVYLETQRSCLQESAWTHLGSGSAIIRFCLDPADIGDEGSAGLAGRFTMLHELAHVWTAEHLSQEEMDSFTSFRGLGTWNDASAAWSDRANEQASDIMAWGLAEEPIDLVRLGTPGCPELELAFRVLTGARPLHGCGTAE